MKGTKMKKIAVIAAIAAVIASVAALAARPAQAGIQRSYHTATGTADCSGTYTIRTSDFSGHPTIHVHYKLDTNAQVNEDKAFAATITGQFSSSQLTGDHTLVLSADWNDNGSPGSMGPTTIPLQCGSPPQKVTICHRTDSVTNPYVQETVSSSSVDGNSGNDNGQGDHLKDHTGPVFQAGMTHNDTWGDIIPPFDTNGNSYDGPPQTSLNWDAAGQTIYNNGCNVPPPPKTQARVGKLFSGGPQGQSVTLKQGGDVVVQHATDGSVSDYKDVAPGSTVEFAEVSDSVNIGDYTTTATCKDQNGHDVAFSYKNDSHTDFTVVVASGQQVTCAFTNVKKESPPPTTRHILVTKECKDVPGAKLNACPSGTFTFQATCPKGQNSQQGTYNSDPLVLATCATMDGGEVCEINVPSNWKNDGAPCVEFGPGTDDVTVHFVNQEVGESPPPGVCPEGTTKINDNPLTCLKTEIIYGSPTCPQGTTQVGSGQGFVVCATTVTVYGNPSCPSGSTQTSSGPGFVVCNTTTTVTNTVTNTVTVYGNPTCPSGTAQTASGQGFVVCNTTTTNTVYGSPTCPSGTKQIGKGQGYVICGKTKLVVKKVHIKAKPKKHPKPKKHKHYVKPPKPFTP
jgi:hypothetical protein